VPASGVDKLYRELIDLIPLSPEKEFLISDKVFIRDRKITYASIITMILSLTAQQKNAGVATNLEQFISFARNSQIWPTQNSIHESSFSKAREKLTWNAFENLHEKFTRLAYTLWDNDPSYTWFGMDVFAVDGSKYSLPATKDLRNEFDPLSGTQNPGKGHFPQCLVNTVYDVFRRIPIARIINPVDTSERKQLLCLMKKIPRKSITILDRGYPSYEVLLEFILNHCGYFLIRCPASNSFPAVTEFVQSQEDDAVITINPSKDYLEKVKGDLSVFRQPITVRAIRIVTIDGSTSVLLTNMLDTTHFCTKEIKKLYLKRETIENYYRDEKTFLQIEKFHSKSVNGIKQELFAILATSVIARILVMWCQKQSGDKTITPRFKHAVLIFATHASILTAKDPQKSYNMFIELLGSIQRVKTYPHRKKRANQPRICKKPLNKWSQYREKRKKEDGVLCKA
jgi:hypothetical protein